MLPLLKWSLYTESDDDEEFMSIILRMISTHDSGRQDDQLQMTSLSGHPVNTRRVGPASEQHWANVLCLLRILRFFVNTLDDVGQESRAR